VSTAKPADVRFYFDQDILGLAHVIAGLRADSTYPGDVGAVIKRRQRPACPVTPGTKDMVWIPQVTDLGWLIITRDSRIQAHKAEIAAVRDSSAKLVASSAVQPNTLPPSASGATSKSLFPMRRLLVIARL